MYSCARLALCFIVPAFSLANGNESDSVLELDCKYTSKTNVIYVTNIQFYNIVIQDRIQSNFNIEE